MPTFSSEKEFNDWNKKQNTKIPRDANGMPIFRDEKHFCEALNDLGFSNVKKLPNNNIIATIKA